jgi:hypothetical protein
VLASAIGRASGLPADLNAPGANFANIIISVPTPGGGVVAMSAQQAVQLGILKQIDGPTQQPAQPAQQQTAPEKTPEQVEAEAAEKAEREAAEKLAAGVFDADQQADLAVADDALARAGLQPDAVIAHIIETGHIQPEALAALVGTGATEQSVLECIGDMNRTVVDALAEAMGGGEAIEFIKHVQESEPEAWNRAALASVRAGTPLPLLRVISQRAEDERAWGGGTW